MACARYEHEHCENNVNDMVSAKCHSGTTNYRRGLRTVCMYYGFICLGMMATILGPTLADMEVLLDTDTTAVGTAFTSNGLGYLAGSAIAGLTYDLLPPEPQLAVAVLLAAGATAAAPVVGGLVGFVAAMAVQGVGMAYVETGTQAFCLSVWREHRYKNSVVQGLFVLWSAGSTLGPLILQAFLDPHVVHQPDTVTPFQASCSFNGSDRHHPPTANPNVTSANISRHVLRTYDAQYKTSSNVEMGYLAMGLLCIPCALLYLATYCAFHNKSQKRPSTSKMAKEKRGKKYFCRELVIIALLFCFFTLYVAQEVTYGGYVFLYVTRALCWSNAHGAMLTSLFWAAVGIGRILSVPFSVWLVPIQMVICDLVLVFSGLLVLLFSAHLHDVIPWVATALAGLGMSTLYPSAYLWISQRVKVAGFATGVFLVGGSMGAMVVPPVTGTLLQNWTPFSFGYMMFGVSTTATVLFLIAFCYERRFISTQHSKVSECLKEEDVKNAKKLMSDNVHMI